MAWLGEWALNGRKVQGFAQNRIWCAIVALAVEITTWMQMPALNGHRARRWEPNGCGYACSPSRRRSPAPAGRSVSTLRPSSLGRPGRRGRGPPTTPGRPWLMLTPPVPTTTMRPRPPGTGAHPRRHSGHRHTPTTESTPAGTAQPQRRLAAM
jgi:hypothetical protein